MKETKLIKISKEAHEKLKSFCKKRAFVMSRWVEIILLKEIKKEENKNGDLQDDKHNK